MGELDAFIVQGVTGSVVDGIIVMSFIFCIFFGNVLLYLESDCILYVP